MEAMFEEEGDARRFWVVWVRQHSRVDGWEGAEREWWLCRNSRYLDVRPGARKRNG